MRGLAAAVLGTILATPGQAQSASPPASSIVHPESWPSPKWPHARDAAIEARITALLKRMTLEEKVGQVIQADISAVTPEEARRYHLGSILNGGNSAPGNDEFAPPAKWLALADAFYDASVDKTGGRTAVPIIWGTDAVHGHSNIVGATLFPHNIGLGAARDPDLIERIGAATAVEIRTTGMEWTFAPTVTVPQDFRWGRAYEGYSSDPAIVKSYSGRMILGLQGKPGAGPLLKGPHVIASTKHFLADGGTEGGVDQGDARISEEVLRDIHGAPYVPAIEAGVATVMASFSSWNGVKLTAHKGLLNDVLKERMNFGGFIVSDWNAHSQVAGCTSGSCPQALLAGLDMYMAPDTWRALHVSLLGQAKDGTLPMARLDDAVSRILRVKLRMGLFEVGRPSSRLLGGKFEELGKPEHRALAREAVRKSLVLLKNQGVLPIRAGARVLVAGDGADDIGRQAGGWTLTWQGTGVDNSRFPGATSIWRGIEAAVKATGGAAELAPDGKFKTKPDIAIVTFGETPYAEFQGDLKTLRLKPENRGALATVKRLKAAGIPVVMVMVTGRPLFVNPEINAADAFVVAWLPGSEGAGVADLLVARRDRRAPYDFTGKLPTAWPATARPGGPVLFPLGHGLKIAGPTATWTALSEDAGVEEAGSTGLFLDKGSATPGWSLAVGAEGESSTRITTVPAAGLSGRVRVTATDHIVQEGARRFDVIKGPAVISLGAQDSIDIARENNGDIGVVLTFRRDTAISGAISLSQVAAGKVARIPAAGLAALPLGTWQTVVVPLSCFAKAGADMTKIMTPLQIEVAGSGSFSLARVALGFDADRRLTCAGELAAK